MAAMAAILDSRSARFELFLSYKSSQCFLPSFESTGLSVQEKKRKIDFQDGGMAAILDFHIWNPYRIFGRNDFSYFWPPSNPNFSYQVSSQLD